jgi:translation elongation factor P/translation initiation factor 5A
MANPALPIIIIWCGITKLLCFSRETYIVVQENNKLVKKKINEVKEGDMVLVYNGKEKKFAKVSSNIKIEGKHEFYQIKMKNINEPEKEKEIKVTGEHIMIVFNDKKEMKLMDAQDLKGDEYIDTDDGLYQIYAINKEINDDKYNLIVNGGVVYANGVFISTICSKEKAKILKPTEEEWKQFQDNKIKLN